MALLVIPREFAVLDGVIQYEVFHEVDDTDVIVIDEDLELYDYKLVRVFGTVHTRPMTLTAWRANGQVWFTKAFAAGESATQNAGGPVKRQSDLPSWVMS